MNAFHLAIKPVYSAGYTFVMFLSRCDNYKFMCVYVGCIISKHACLFSLQCISASLACADFFH